MNQIKVTVSGILDYLGIVGINRRMFSEMLSKYNLPEERHCGFTVYTIPDDLLFNLCVDNNLYCMLSKKDQVDMNYKLKDYSDDIERSVSRRNRSKNQTSSYYHPKYLYIFGLMRNNQQTDLIKVGISNAVEHRMISLSNSWSPIGVSFYLKYKTTVKVNKAEPIEKSIHRILESFGYKYEAKHKYTGYSELFRDNDLVYDIVRSINKQATININSSI